MASIITLTIGATGIFIEIQDSLNIIWGVKAKPKRGLVQFIKNRLLSACLVISLGFLMVDSFLINGVVQALSNILSAHFSWIAVNVIAVINFIVTIIIISLFVFSHI